MGKLDQVRAAKESFKKMITGTPIETSLNGVGITRQEETGEFALVANMKEHTPCDIYSVDDIPVIYRVVGDIRAQREF